MLTAVREGVRNRKTYIVCVGLIIFAIVGLQMNKIDSAQSIQLVLEALAIAGLRGAIGSKPESTQ